LVVFLAAGGVSESDESSELEAAAAGAGVTFLGATLATGALTLSYT